MSVTNSAPPDIGAVLRRIRQQRGLSLDETSVLTSVSKAMLGQIERGESSPTVSTLWKISTGLHVTFSTLMETCADTQAANLTVASARNNKPVFEAGEDFILHDTFPFDPAAGFEVFTITVKPGCHYTSPTHHNVITEYVLVSQGTLSLTVEGKLFLLEQGMSIKFAGTAKHSYANTGLENTVFFNIIRY